jgi:hypothetical protein
MKRTIDLDQVRVVQAANSKGNLRVYLEIMDTRILYSEPRLLPQCYISEDGTADTDSLEDLFRNQLGRILARLLLENCPGLSDSEDFGVWVTHTDREIDYTKPRLEEDPYT